MNVRLKTICDNMGSSVLMARKSWYSQHCLTFWKGKDYQEMKIIDYSFISIWLDLSCLLKCRA